MIENTHSSPIFREHVKKGMYVLRVAKQLVCGKVHDEILDIIKETTRPFVITFGLPEELAYSQAKEYFIDLLTKMGGPEFANHCISSRFNIEHSTMMSTFKERTFSKEDFWQQSKGWLARQMMEFKFENLIRVTFNEKPFGLTMWQNKHGNADPANGTEDDIGAVVLRKTDNYAGDQDVPQFHHFLLVEDVAGKVLHVLHDKPHRDIVQILKQLTVPVVITFGLPK